VSGTRRTFLIGSGAATGAALVAACTKTSSSSGVTRTTLGGT
jgi:hypothetical protein